VISPQENVLTKKVKEEAERMNIVLVYLSPYSPDLNPIVMEEC